MFVSGEDKLYGGGTATVYFPTVGTTNLTNSDYNKAHVAIKGDNGYTTQSFGTLNYTHSDDKRLGEKEEDKKYLATTSASATFAGSTPHYYQTVLPNEAGATLTLRVNYTLVANDGSGETIKVYGAKAIVPAKFAEWKSNYAYTYVFKISDKTNGKTDITKGPEGLYPITFDAVVADSEIGNQTTITTVATPSITTYQRGHDIAKNEYSAKTGVIYVMVENSDALAADLTNKAKLYTINDTKSIGISEATVHDALTIGASKTGTTTTGRNGIALTEATMNTTITNIKGVDGNDITVTANTAASFTPVADTNYAFVYDTTTGTPEGTAYYTAVTPAKGTDISTGFYEDPDGKTAAKGTADGTTAYYQKVINTNKTYAIKVIQVVK